MFQPSEFMLLPSDNVPFCDSQDVFDARRTVHRVQPSTLAESNHSIFDSVLTNLCRTHSFATHFANRVVAQQQFLSTDSTGVSSFAAFAAADGAEELFDVAAREVFWQFIRVWPIGFSTVRTKASYQSLSHHTFDGAGDKIRLDPHIN